MGKTLMAIWLIILKGIVGYFYRKGPSQNNPNMSFYNHFDQKKGREV